MRNPRTGFDGWFLSRPLWERIFILLGALWSLVIVLLGTMIGEAAPSLVAGPGIAAALYWILRLGAMTFRR